ncbi:MAG TPA: hypothetical protein PK605_05165 [Ignavibacteria bacterium]|nr:hypothetical protein [Ignavibacteria bacterium]HRJ03773.1 hypothetical protein [Ignavibacteria bacterium]
MKKITSLLFLILLTVIFSQGNSYAQLTGVKTIPGTYASITAAITDLNTQGVGIGGVTFNVAAGYTETGVNVVLTCPTNPPSVSKPIIFQKSGAGANPLLTAGVGTSTTTDGIWKLNGVSYVTIDGIDLQESASNTDATTQMEWGYALVKQSGTLACQFTTIKNCTITLNKANTASTGIYIGNHTAISTTGLTVSAFLGTSSYNRFYNNIVQNSYFGYQIQGFGAAAPYDLYDQYNEVGTESGGRSQVLNFGGSSVAAYGIFGINQNAMKIFNTNINSTGGTNSTGILYGIFTSTGNNSSVDIYGDTISVVGGGTTSAVMGINNTFGATGAGNVVNIYNNVIQNCSYPTATSGEFRGINMASTAATTNIYNNKIINNTHIGTGAWAGIQIAGSSAVNMISVNIYNNQISGNTKSGTSGIMYCINASSSNQISNCYNNNIFNNTASASTSAVYGYYNFAIGFVENVYNNQINNLTGGSAEVVGIYARSGSNPTDKQVYGNTVHTIAGTAQVGGIWCEYAGTNLIYGNRIYNLSSTTTSLTPGVYGIQYGTNQGLIVGINNNFISDLRSPNNTSIGSIYGIWMAGATVTIAKIYYNTVYLNAATTSATSFGTAALLMQSTPFTVDLRNNVLVNVSTPGPTSGRTTALQRNTTTLTNYNLLSGNNCLYAGTPGAANVIYFDGTNADQTIQAFKDRVTPREQASFTELPPFVNIAATPYDLHMQTGIATQTEKGGQPVDITIDYDGTTRSSTFPDVGADEFAGIMNDIASPNIQYTTLTNSDITSPRVLTNFAVITDPSNINTTAGTRPRIYYKKSTNANTYADNTNATDGWKYTEATNTSSPFSFSMDYSLINGGIAAGNIIQYFVVAQDLNTTPRIGLNAGAFTTQPASVNLAAANFPLTSTINQFTIVNTVYSGSINVGTSETITSLTNAGGLFELINAGALSGNLTVNITSDLTAELGTNALNQWSEVGTGGYTLTIQPNSATTRLISGTVAAGLIRLNGADRLRIDGRSGGSGMFLTFRNISTSGPVIQMINDAQNNIIRNCILEGTSTSTSGNTAGVVNIGTTTLANGNDNNTITYNEIRDRSDATGRPTMGIFSTGSTTALSTYNNNCVISNNNIHDWFIDGSTTQFAVNISTGNSGWSIDSNSFYQTAARTNTITGGGTRAINISFAATIASNGGFNVRNNFIGGTAPGATGGDWTINVGGTAIVHTFIPISLTTGLIPNTVSGNVIRNIDFTTVSPTAAATQFAGMSLAAGLYNVSGNTIGATTGNGSIKLTINVSTGTNSTSFLAGVLFGSTSPCGMDMLNNNIGSITIAGTATAAVFMQCVQHQGNPVTTSLFQGNVIGSTTTANSIQLNVPAQALIFGMRSTVANGYIPVINNNIIQNITDNSSNANTQDFGILLTSTAGPSGTVTVTNNTISNVASNNSIVTGTLCAFGISVQNFNSPNSIIAGNTINGIRNINAGVLNNAAVGLYVVSNTIGGSINRNKIYDVTNQSTGTALVLGIYAGSGNNLTMSNNMVSLTNGESSMQNANQINNFDNKVDVNYQPTDFNSVAAMYPAPLNYVYDASKEPSGEQPVIGAEDIKTEKIPIMTGNKSSNTGDSEKEQNVNTSSFTNAAVLYGIADAMTPSTNLNLYYNSVYIGGSAVSGALNSYAYMRFSGANVTLRNNLLYNGRTGGTGFHYAIGNNNAAPSTGWLSTSSDYNAFVTADSSYIGEWGTGVNQNILQWRASSSGDNYSWYAKTSQVSAANLFTSVSTGDLHTNSSNSAAWLVNGKGISLGSINVDYDGNARSTSITGGVTDIGADEFTATPPSNPVALQSAPPSSGGTTDYVLYGRTIASITWGTGGTYPTSMNVNYFSGVNPLAPNVTNPQRVSNSYWTIAPATGTFSGTTYDVTFNYGDNETFSVTSPSTNVLIAKNDNTFWMSYPRGTGSLQSEQTGNSAKVRGLFRFSSFTLTDAALPSERPLTPVNNATNQPTSVTLVWNKSLLATTYRVQVSTDSLFSTLILNDSTVTDSTRLVSGLGNGVNYFWRVNGKSGIGTGAWSQVFKFTTTAVLPPAVVNLTVIPGGFYNTGNGRLNMKDTIRVYLVDSVTCQRVDSTIGVVDSVNFQAAISFSNANTGNYYMMVYHRNHLAVATRFRATVTRGSAVNYDFTTDSAKAFGFNMVKVSSSPVRWAMIPGDANRDGFVDGLDQTIWIGQNGLDGYRSADFNGDRFVDGLDQTIWILFNGNGSFLPCGFFMDPVTDKIQPNTPNYDAKKGNMELMEKKRMNGNMDMKK